MTAKYRASLVVLFVMGVAVAIALAALPDSKAEHNEGKVKDHLYYPAIARNLVIGSPIEGAALLIRSLQK